MSIPATLFHGQDVQREDFGDGSALVTFPDGSQLIIETDLARDATLRECSAMNYNPPPLPLIMHEN